MKRPEPGVIIPSLRVPRYRLEVTPGSEDDDPFDCTACPDDPRPHLHCPWGGMHKHYADEEKP